ncbi:MAG: hypothetical protein ACI9G1_004835 [Pirellulaceae bacterium]|jgi:hypothetical protein
MRIKTLIANFDTNTAVTAGNLVVATRDARSYRIPSSRYQGNCAIGSQGEYHAIKPGSLALRGNFEHSCSVLERGMSPRPPQGLKHPIGQSMPSHQLYQWMTDLGVIVLGSAT